VLVLNPLYVKARRGTTWRGTETDPVDARLMAEILPREQVPASPVPEAEGQGVRDLTRRRADVVAQTGDVKRRIISRMERTFPAFAPGCTAVCGQAARALLESWPLAEDLAAVPTARLAAVLARLSHGHLGAEKAREVQAAAPQRIGGRRAAAALAFDLRVRLRQLRELERLVAAREQEIGRRYTALDQYWRTIPGLGTAPAPAMYAEIGDIPRVTDADPLVALAGVDPQVHESGQTAGQVKRSKRGSP
jgi:transposase